MYIQGGSRVSVETPCRSYHNLGGGSKTKNADFTVILLGITVGNLLLIIFKLHSDAISFYILTFFIFLHTSSCLLGTLREHCHKLNLYIQQFVSTYFKTFFSVANIRKRSVANIRNRYIISNKDSWITCACLSVCLCFSVSFSYFIAIYYLPRICILFCNLEETVWRVWSTPKWPMLVCLSGFCLFGFNMVWFVVCQ